MSESTDDEVRDRRPLPARRDAALSPARAEAHAEAIGNRLCDRFRSDQ